MEAVRAEMQSAVTRLETEVAELQQSRQSLQHDSAQQLESLDRLRRENAELLQRVSDIHDLTFCDVLDVLFYWGNISFRLPRLPRTYTLIEMDKIHVSLL